MGMKRRGMGRRQVLNLNDKQDSPRRTWQTKYQQICSDGNQNGTYSDVISSTSSKSPMKNNPLSGLLGHYHSDSDTEEDSNKEVKDDLSSQVSDFMKEIQTIAPAAQSSSHDPQVLSVTNIGPEKKASEQVPQHVATMAWQECYDENSGYAYYWNMETNEVTWEMPPEYQTYMESVAGQDNPWTHEQHMSMAYNPHAHLMAHHHHHHHHMPHLPHQHHHHHLNVPGVPSVLDAAYVDKPHSQGSIEIENHEERLNNRTGPDKKKRKNKDVDSDDEKIEMITSYGPASDEESEEEDDDETVPSEKKRKTMDGGAKQLKNKRTSAKPVSSLSPGPEDLGAPGDEDSRGEDSPADMPLTKDSATLPNQSQLDNDESPLKLDQNAMPDSSEEKVKSDESSSCVKAILCDAAPVQLQKSSNLKTEERELSEDAVMSGTSTPQVTDGENDLEGVDSDERTILLRLRKQARLLRELGGEIPDEVQHLIEPSTSSASPLQADDVIAQIEKELPPDYKTGSAKSSSSHSLGQHKKQTLSGNKNGPKFSSFALIAGYGDDCDDSDTEEEKKNYIRNSKDEMPIERKLEKGSLFPIIGSSEKSNVESLMECEIISIEKNSETVNGSVSSDCASTSKVSRVNEPCEMVTSNSIVSLETSLPDSTTNCKLFKRKKRLDVEVLPAVSSKQAIVIAQPADSEIDKKTIPVASVSSAVSSSAAFSSWTQYGADPCSSERRGFGFQSNNESHSILPVVEIDSDIQIVKCDGDKKGISHKKGMINFVKADVLNPEVQPDVEAVDQTVKVEKSPQDEKQDVVKESLETDKAIEDMAELIREKVNFLGEGKEPVPPVQVMAIQIETLVSAWETGALSHSYWSSWLADTSTELARLEQEAAPSGWACEWDRSYKRYFYRHISSGETQWEYPSSPEEDAMELCTTPPPPPPPIISRDESAESTRISTRNVSGNLSPVSKKKKAEETVTSSSEDSKEAAGEPATSDFMKTNDADIQPPSVPPPPPPQHPPTPPPPPPSAPPPPPPPRNPPTPPPPPPPPLSDELPPLPPNTPPLPPNSPPPLPPSPPSPPPPPAIHSHGNELGEPLPPGVDPPELPYIVARPKLSTVSAYPGSAPPLPPNDTVFAPPLPSQSPPDTTDIMSSIIHEETMPLGAMPHHLQTQYVMGNAYQQTALVTSSISAIPMTGAPGMEYGPVHYVPNMGIPAMPAPSVHVIAKPPAKKAKSSLHAELDSFYSDLASLESVGSGPSAAAETAADQTPVAENNPAAPAPLQTQQLQHPDSNSLSVVAPASHSSQTVGTVATDEIPSKSTDTSSQENRKKKKPKLAPGLALKKKGVSSLVAKWQQVQQEVRRDYKNLDEEDGVSSTHK